MRGNTCRTICSKENSLVLVWLKKLNRYVVFKQKQNNVMEKFCQAESLKNKQTSPYTQHFFFCMSLRTKVNLLTVIKPTNWTTHD